MLSFPSPSFLHSAPLFSPNTILLQPPFPDFAIFPTFGASLIFFHSLSCPHIHRSILISATSNFFSCASFSISAPYISAGLTTVLCTFHLIFTFTFLSHNTPHTLLPWELLVIWCCCFGRSRAYVIAGSNMRACATPVQFQMGTGFTGGLADTKAKEMVALIPEGASLDIKIPTSIRGNLSIPKSFFCHLLR